MGYLLFGQYTFTFIVLGGGPTIMGDDRQHHFRTTHTDQYRGASLPRLTAFPAVSQFFLSIFMYLSNKCFKLSF